MPIILQYLSSIILFRLYYLKTPLQNTFGEMDSNVFLNLSLKYKQSINQMQSINSNCFKECLKSQEDEQDIPERFKAKKGKKCLTLVKDTVNKKNSNYIQTKPSISLERSAVQQRAIKTLIQKAQPFLLQPKRENVYSNHVIYDRLPLPYQPKRYTIVPRIQYKPVQQQQHEPDQRSRRFSDIAFTNNPTIISSSNRSSSFDKSAQSKSTPQQKSQQPMEQIKQQQNERKRSSLFQGAKNIISKLLTSSIEHQKQSIIFHTNQKQANSQIKLFYQNVRLCQTEHIFNNTNSTIKSQHQQSILVRQISIDSMAMSPKEKSNQKYKQIRMIKLLGVGRWAHVYLCQQTRTNFIYSIKEIFKESLQAPLTIQRIRSNISRFSEISHSKIITLYSKFQKEDKLCLISEYCMKSLYDELKGKEKLSLKQVKKFTTDLIQAIVFLHENRLVHGRISIFGVFINFDECKLKLNVIDTYPSGEMLDFKGDIVNLAVLLHEMAYGISSLVKNKQTMIEREKQYQQRELKEAVVSSIKDHISLHEGSNDQKKLNNLISMLLNWSPQTRLTSSICLSHPFLSQPLLE